MGQWDQGLSDGKDNIYLAGIKHCMLVLLIRSFTHKFIIQNRGRKEKEDVLYMSLFCSGFLVFLSVLPLQLCDTSYLLLLIPDILFGGFV